MDMQISKVEQYLNNYEKKIRSLAGRRGVVEKRKKLEKYKSLFLHKRLSNSQLKFTITDFYRNERIRKCLGLARMAGQYYDEHGSYIGDYRQTKYLDYIESKEAKLTPYLDMGGCGLGLIEICRTRMYARSYKFGPSTASTKYLVGRNEIGTFFAHSIYYNCYSVYEAIRWIWSGHLNIIARQGDIALIKGKGPKIPKLPFGHKIEGEFIVHETHPKLRLPKKNERIIVARRAFERVSQSSRD